MAVEELYISVDIEADGRVPGLSSMLSLGAAAFTLDKEILGNFTCNFEVLPEGVTDKAVDEFWQRNPLAYQATRTNLVSPENGSKLFVSWLDAVKSKYKPIFVGYPAVYDFKWLDYYCIRFTGKNPFGHSGCIDMKSFAWARLGGKFSYASKRNFPKTWFDKTRHMHVALDDAIEQGAMFINMLREAQGLSAIDG